MAEHKKSSDEFLVQTRFVFLWTRLLSIPFWGMFSILPFIIRKDLDATYLQIAIVIALKPAVSLFSPYWSMWVHGRQDRLVSNLVWANILKFLPFLFFPWMTNSWLFVFSFGIYMLFARGMIPAWMEIIKSNIRDKTRERIFQMVSTVDYLGTAALPFAFGWVLDNYEQSWRWIFLATAAIGALSTLLLLKIPIKFSSDLEKREKLGWQQLIKPWKESWQLLRTRSDFARFQVGFMLGGGGLMMMHAVLPMFFMDVLGLSFTSLLTAMTLCKGVGFALASPFCVRWFRRQNIYRFCSWVTLAAAVFPLLLVAAVWHVFWMYLAYLVYGIMQAGSELSWHMSGPIFSKEQDSSIYSSTNVLAVGVRGCLAPIIGSLIYTETNAFTVLLIGSSLCFFATERLWTFSRSLKPALGLPA